VLEENTSILLVDTDGILDGGTRTRPIHKGRIHIMDRSFAVTTQFETVGHVSGTIFTKVKGVLSMMGMFRVAVGYYHLCQRETIEHRSHRTLVIVGDVVEDDALSVIESDMEIPVLPADMSTIDLERDTVRLGDIQGGQIFSEPSLSLNGCSVVVARRGRVDRTSDSRDVDVDDLSCVAVVYGAEVQGVGVLIVVLMRAIVHDGLL
jgi:hypothetical protein